MNTQSKPQLPVTFGPQTIARIFQQITPKYYQIITKNSLIFSAIAFALPYVTTWLLPGLGVGAPKWLTFANETFVSICFFLAGMGAGGAGVAQTTIQTKDTPPLVTSDKPKPDDVSALVAAEVERQMAQIRNKTSEASPTSSSL